jgi:hypothetical protein
MNFSYIEILILRLYCSLKELNCTIFEVYKVVNHVMIFWIVTTYSDVGGHRSFGVTSP